MTVRWTTSPPDPPVFTMLLRDASLSSVVNPLAVAANVPSAPGSFELDLPTVPVSQTYQLLFVDTRDLTRIFATSSIFPITNFPITSSSETVTRSTFTVTVTLSSPPSSITTPATSVATAPTTPPPISGISTTVSGSPIPASETRLTTSTLGTVPAVTVTVTVPPNPDASFVPINAAERPMTTGNWLGSFIIAMVLLHLGGL